MGQWTFPGPDQLRLSKEEVLAILGVSTAALDRMIRAGRFPTGYKPTAQSKPFWTSADIAAWLHLSPRMHPPEEKSQEN